MLVVGLTGGIACGKSTVADILRAQGVPVLGLDQVARTVVEPGTPALAEIQARWPDVVEGRLNRKALGALVVKDKAVKATLERITHPRIFAHLDAWLAGRRADGNAAVVVEDATMVENGSHTRYDKLLVVACSPATQRARLAARDGYTAEQVEGWLALQLPLADKVRLADAVVYNDGDASSLTGAVLAAWAALSA